MQTFKRSFAAVIALFAAALAPAASAETIALVNARVIDGTGAPPREGRTILVENGRIAALFDGNSRQPPSGARIIDLDGLTVLPGLIDGHVHLLPVKEPVAQLKALLESGVTTVRELAGDARRSSELARRAASGEIVSPAIFYSAAMFGPGFFEDDRSQRSAGGNAPGESPWSRVVTPDSDIARIVSEAKATGATGLKLYASLSPALVRALTQEGHRQGLLVWAHAIIFPAGVEDGVEAGADSIIHAKGMITLGRDDVPANFKEGTQVWVRQFDFASTDPGSAPFQALYADMVRRGTILEPALMADGERRPKPLPPWMAAMRDWSCRATAEAHKAGVTISAGTDSQGVAGEIQSELERLTECGLTPLAAIRSATINNARTLGREGSHGTVEAGKAADLIAVAGDPAVDISALRNVRMVMKAGRMIVDPRPEQ